MTRSNLAAPLLAAALALAGLVPTAPAAAGGVEELSVGAGVFAVGEVRRAAEMSVEVRLGRFSLPRFPRWFRIQPAAGAMANDVGGRYVWAGFRLPVDLGHRWSVAAYSGGGYYERGDGKELGGPFEFRSGLEVAARVGERSQLGATFYHLSNAGIYYPNPGLECLEVVYSYRFRK